MTFYVEKDKCSECLLINNNVTDLFEKMKKIDTFCSKHLLNYSVNFLNDNVYINIEKFKARPISIHKNPNEYPREHILLSNGIVFLPTDRIIRKKSSFVVGKKSSYIFVNDATVYGLFTCSQSIKRIKHNLRDLGYNHSSSVSEKHSIDCKRNIRIINIEGIAYVLDGIMLVPRKGSKNKKILKYNTTDILEKYNGIEDSIITIFDKFESNLYEKYGV